MLTDLTFVPLLEKMQAQLPTVEKYIVLTDAAHMQQTTLAQRRHLTRNGSRTPTPILHLGRMVMKMMRQGMCYTSGTTGNPKGVVYSHRSNILTSMAVTTPDMLAHILARCGAADCAAVPCQFLVARLFSADDGRKNGDAGHETRWCIGV